ncbi:hypothetical protein GCM10009609_59360 [Pseudonocardia aurantiaca]|uniref:DUF5667 domain-containing protein n=1 Tax=Pseudonocardia aurantiaca TaxID=75290 RepID=A0ABW4FVB3_9PSEU
MPAGQGKDAERFAAAVEQGTPLGFAGDDELARELEIVAMLRSAGPAFTPDPDAKARARQRLMALVAEQGEQRGSGRATVAPPTPEETTAPMGRVLEASFPTPRAEVDTAAETTQLAPVTPGQPVAEDEVDEAAETTPTTPTAAPSGRPGRRARHSVANRPAGRARSSRRPAPSMRRRVVLVGTAALVMMLALTGGGVLASRNALPGDTLYALKRVAESAELALTFDEAAKAERHLEIAGTRLSEVEQLVARDTQVTDPEVYRAAIQEFDTATGEGSQLLLTAAQSGGDTGQLDSLHTWVAEQSARLTQLRPALPVPAAANADGSIQLLDLLLGRTEALGARSACSESGAGGNLLGPVPAEGDCTPRSVNQSGPDTPNPGRTGNPATPGSRTPAPSGTEAPSGTPSQTPSGEQPGLLPDLGLNGPSSGGSEDGESEGGSSPTESKAPGPGGAGAGGVNVPLPLLPPVTLPPLLPGMPPITIG